MKNILKISSAIIGAVLGAGFASGQEVMQYFTSFGRAGILGAIVVAVLFGILTMLSVNIGFKLKAVSHMEVIRQLSGRYLGMGYDLVIIFTLYGIGAVMLAGAGPVFNEQFNIPTYIGTMLMSVLVLVTIMAGVKRVVQMLAVLTPIFLLVIVFVNIYSMINSSPSANLEAIAVQQPSITNNWFSSAFNNVSLLIIMNAAMLFIMGGSETNGKQATIGGLLGGMLCGVLILVSNMAIYQNIDIVASLQMPTLGLANQISPFLGLIYSITLFGMIFGTAVSMFFSFSARFFEPKTKGFKLFSLIALIVGSSLSFYGFSDLVSIVFPIIGYLGYIFIGILIIGFFRIRSKSKLKSKDNLEEYDWKIAK